MNANPTKKFSWKSATLLFLGAGVLAGCISIFVQVRVETIYGSLAEDPTSVATTSVAVGLGFSFEAPSRPVRLLIPAIGVDAAVQNVGLAWHGDGSMGVPTNFTDVGWYERGPRPGMPGSAVIDGHLDGKDVPRAVFYYLDTLKPGDLVEVVDAGGRTWRFRVIATKVYDADAVTTEVFSGDMSKARLNLITCAGGWDKTKKRYDERIVVFTELI